MNEERKKWQGQFIANLGAREFLRFVCVVLIWQAAGLGLMLVSGKVGFVLISQSVMWCFFWFSPVWQPMYKVLRWILGNRNLPDRTVSWKPSVWTRIAIGLLIVFHASLLYKGFELLFQ